MREIKVIGGLIKRLTDLCDEHSDIFFDQFPHVMGSDNKPISDDEADIKRKQCRLEMSATIGIINSLFVEICGENKPEKQTLFDS